jgi:hypothetical protein
LVFHCLLVAIWKCVRSFTFFLLVAIWRYVRSFIYRELPRLVAGLLIGVFAAFLSAAACSESAFLTESARRVESALEMSVESRLITESPASGGASGCLK